MPERIEEILQRHSSVIPLESFPAAHRLGLLVQAEVDSLDGEFQQRLGEELEWPNLLEVVEEWTVRRFDLLLDCIVAAAASIEPSQLNSFLDPILDKLEAASVEQMNKVLAEVPNEIKDKLCSRIVLKISGRKRIARSKAVRMSLEKPYRQHTTVGQANIAHQMEVPKAGRGRKPDEDIQKRREIVNRIIKKPSDFQDKGKVDQLFQALDAKKIPLPRQAGTHPRSGRYTDTKGNIRTKILRTLEKDLQRK